MSNRFPWTKSGSSVVFTVGLMLVVLTLAQSGSGAIFSYKDENGKTHYTDSPSKIPPQYRDKSKGLTEHRERSEPGAESPSHSPDALNASTVQFGPTDLGLHEIELIPTAGGGNYMVKTVLNGSVQAMLMVDTGASMITLSPAIGKKLGIRSGSTGPELPFNTAGGMVWSPVLQLEQVSVGDATVRGVEASVNEYMEGMDGLLGMTFLGEYLMSINRSSNTMTLKPLTGSNELAWAGKNETWWKNKFSELAGMITQYDDMAQYFKRRKHRKAKNIESLVDHYQLLHDQLNQRAKILGVPAKLKSFPKKNSSQ